MPKMLAGIRRIADLDATPSAALPLPYSEEQVTAPSMALELASDDGVSAPVALVASDDAWAEPIADESTETDIMLAAELAASSAPIEQYPQHDHTPLFAERAQPLIQIDHQPAAPEPFFTHQRAHDEMLRRAAPQAPALSLTQRIAAVEFAPAASNANNQAVAIYHAADAEPPISIQPDQIETISPEHSYEDDFLSALAEQESAREDVQMRMQEQFLAHERAHEEMLRRISVLTPAPSPEAADADDQAWQHDTIETIQPLASHQTSEPSQPAAVARHSNVAPRPDQPFQRAMIASAVPPSAAIDWQPLDKPGITKRRRKPARSATAVPRAKRESIVQSMARIAATLVIATGAYFTFDSLTDQRLESLRIATINLIKQSETQIAAVDISPVNPSVAPAKVATVTAIAPQLERPMPLPVATNEPIKPSVAHQPPPLVVAVAPAIPTPAPPPRIAAEPPAAKPEVKSETSRAPAHAEAVAAPTAALKAIAPVMPIPVPMQVRVGQLNAAEPDTITRLVHPPVLIRKRQQIAAAVRPSDQDFDPRSAPGASPRNTGPSLALSVEQGAAAAALPAIVPPKPKLVRESLVRTALAQTTRNQMTDVLVTTNTDAQQHGRRVTINRTQVINTSPVPRVRPTRVATLDTSRQTHATVGIEARAIASKPVRTTTATAAWRRGEHLYARATLGRGQHAPDYGFSGEGPHAANSNGQRDAYISILGFHVRRAQPVWASRLFDSRY